MTTLTSASQVVLMSSEPYTQWTRHLSFANDVVAAVVDEQVRTLMVLRGTREVGCWRCRLRECRLLPVMESRRQSSRPRTQRESALRKQRSSLKNSQFFHKIQAFLFKNAFSHFSGVLHDDTTLLKES